MGAVATHLSQLDRVQHHALTLIGTGAAMDTLSLRRRVAGLTTLYELRWHYITSPPALAATRPARAIAPTIAPATRRRSAANLAHELQLQTALPSTCQVVQCCAVLFPGVSHRSLKRKFNGMKRCTVCQRDAAVQGSDLPLPETVGVVIGHGHHPLGYCQYDPVHVLGALPSHQTPNIIIICPYLSLTLLHSHSNLSSKRHGNQPILSSQHRDLDTAIVVLVWTHIFE